jgi:hypothetical protein
LTAGSAAYFLCMCFWAASVGRFCVSRVRESVGPGIAVSVYRRSPRVPIVPLIP